MKTWGDQGVGLNSGGMALQWFPIQQLLWLPVPLRVEFRLAVLVRKAVNSLTYNCHRSPSTLIVRQLQVFRPQNTLTSSRRLKPGPHQQQCRRNIVECYNVERVLRWNFVLSTKSNVALTLLPKRETLSKLQATKLPSKLPVASTMLLVWTGLYARITTEIKCFS